MFKYVSVAYFVFNFWIIWWFWRALRASGWVRPIVCLLLIGWAACFPFLYRTGDASLLQVWLLRLGAFWLAAFIYLFFTVFLLDVLGLFKWLFKEKSTAYMPSKPVRARYGACIGVVVFVAAIVGASWWNAMNPQLVEVDLTVEVADPQALGLQDNTLTIAAISDVHLGRLVSAERFDQMLGLLPRDRVDAVFFVGDLIDDPVVLDVPAMRASVDAVNARLGVFGILGNHEYVWDVNTNIEAMRNSGIQVLRDQWAVLGDAVLVVGRDEYSRQYYGDYVPRASLKDILNTVPVDSRGLPMLLLDHQPRDLEVAQQAGAALQLSGHTHNGQIFPFNLIGAVIYEKQSGYYQRGATQYYISVGAGTWGPPVRNTARPEVLLIRIQFVPNSSASAR